MQTATGSFHPRYPCEYTTFPRWRTRPLCDPSNEYILTDKKLLSISNGPKYQLQPLFYVAFACAQPLTDVKYTVMSLIEIEEISKVYGFGDATNVALDEVSLTIERGEFIAVMTLLLL